MKKYEIYNLLQVIDNLLKTKESQLKVKALYSLIKNKKILQEEKNLLEEMFDPKKIDNYQLFEKKRQEIVNNFRNQNQNILKDFDKLSNQEKNKINNQLNLKINDLQKDKELKEFFKNIKQQDIKRNQLLNQEYEVNNLHLINIQQIEDLQVTPIEMESLINLIKE